MTGGESRFNGTWNGGMEQWNGGTVEWNSGMVERWNNGMGNYDYDPVPHQNLFTRQLSLSLSLSCAVL